jgi:hypothetical protein
MLSQLTPKMKNTQSSQIEKLHGGLIADAENTTCTPRGLLTRAALYELMAFDMELPARDRAKAEQLSETLRFAAKQMRDFLPAGTPSLKIVGLAKRLNVSLEWLTSRSSETIDDLERLANLIESGK